jgi:hypothetical protein
MSYFLQTQKFFFILQLEARAILRGPRCHKQGQFLVSSSVSQLVSQGFFCLPYNLFKLIFFYLLTLFTLVVGFTVRVDYLQFFFGMPILNRVL